MDWLYIMMPIAGMQIFWPGLMAGEGVFGNVIGRPGAMPESFGREDAGGVLAPRAVLARLLAVTAFPALRGEDLVALPRLTRLDDPGALRRHAAMAKLSFSQSSSTPSSSIDVS